MKIYLTLDYELFLGQPGIQIESELLLPTKHFTDLLDVKSLKAIFFVDAGYLFALNRYKDDNRQLESDYLNIQHQLNELVNKGHEIGLHTHPHWEDSIFVNGKWKMNLSRYRLANFEEQSAKAIFKKYHHILDLLSPGKIISHRSGGWCLEPFSVIREEMKELGIFIDSTAFVGGYEFNKTHDFDFRRYPEKDYWRFSDHPSTEDTNGWFIELPATSCITGPLIYWKTILKKIFYFDNNKNKGKSVQKPLIRGIQKLTTNSVEAVSIDGEKSKYLLSSLQKAEQNRSNHFCIIGHPKCFTPATFKNLENFINYALSNGHEFTTFYDEFYGCRDCGLNTDKYEL